MIIPGSPSCTSSQPWAPCLSWFREEEARTVRERRPKSEERVRVSQGKREEAEDRRAKSEERRACEGGYRTVPIDEPAAFVYRPMQVQLRPASLEGARGTDRRREGGGGRDGYITNREDSYDWEVATLQGPDNRSGHPRNLHLASRTRVYLSLQRPCSGGCSLRHWMICQPHRRKCSTLLRTSVGLSCRRGRRSSDQARLRGSSTARASRAEAGCASSRSCF